MLDSTLISSVSASWPLLTDSQKRTVVSDLLSSNQGHLILKRLEEELARKQLEVQRLEAQQAEEAVKRGTPAPPPEPIWKPFPGPQQIAYESQADEIFYGGAAGGGKSDLLLGIAGTQHRHSIIFRRVFPSTRALIERSREIYKSGNTIQERALDSYNESLHVWRLDGNTRMVEFGSIQYEKDLEKYRGRPHDLYGFDEVTEFPKRFVKFVTAWNRTTIPGQRCRIVMTGNPPTNAEGQWVIEYFAPWLDKRHPNPARPGELRWFVTVNDRDFEVPGPDLVYHEGHSLVPRSRTFIPAKLSDNPILAATPTYLSTLQSLEEPLRSQLLFGDFSIGVEDDMWQCIPTKWVLAAIDRGKKLAGPPEGQKLTAMGVDVAHGGRARTTIAKRWGTYFGKVIKKPGVETPDGMTAARVVFAEYEQGAVINVDAIGYGASCCERLQQDFGLAEYVNAINASTPTQLYDKTGKYRLTNIRAAMYWKMREALDPYAPDPLYLPDDPEIVTELCAPRWEVTPAGIKLEAKEDVAGRLGRSPDVGDAIVQANFEMLNTRVVQGSLLCWPPVPGSEEAKELGEAELPDRQEEVYKFGDIEVRFDDEPEFGR